MIRVYTDGSYKPTLNQGGYSSVITEDGKVIKILYQGFKNTTNNRQELKGVLEALKYFKTPQVLEIYSDSSYVVSSINNGHVARWIEEKDDSKKNMDLWTEIYKLIQFHKVTFVWVKGHNNNEFNELADLYAQHAAECLELTEDEKKVIKAAKLKLMNDNGFDEQGAHRYLQKKSMDNGINIVEMAYMILEHTALF